MRPVLITLVILLLPCGALCAGTPLSNEPVTPVPASLKVDPQRARLGARLFREVRLSGNNRIACASCHDLAKGGADGQRVSPGVQGGNTELNTPTVLNAALNFRQFWNGRASTLEAQIDLVLQNPVEMGSNWPDVVRKLGADASYRQAFASAYPGDSRGGGTEGGKEGGKEGGISKENIMNALASFERTLITPGSRFDRYLLGESDAISAAEKNGYAKFKQYGCAACHQGVNVGGNMFQKFGIMGDYFAGRANPTQADLGRALVTGKDADRNVFKVPGLRNVELTAPYLHDGSAKTLDAAVEIMFRYQLGRVASSEDRHAIVLFLKTLTGVRQDTP